MVPLPKIDEMYARFAGLSINSTLDLRSGYCHIALSADSQRKSACVIPMGKFEFQKVPFEFVQAPAYFQWLVNEVLSGLDFAFSYLDDILIYSLNQETHLRHTAVVFQCLLKPDLN